MTKNTRKSPDVLCMKNVKLLTPDWSVYLNVLSTVYWDSSFNRNRDKNKICSTLFMVHLLSTTLAPMFPYKPDSLTSITLISVNGTILKFYGRYFSTVLYPSPLDKKNQMSVLGRFKHEVSAQSQGTHGIVFNTRLNLIAVMTLSHSFFDRN